MEIESQNQAGHEFDEAGNSLEPLVYDVDHPHWGPFAGVAIWLFSFIFPLFLVIPWLIYERLAGNLEASQEADLQAWSGSARGFLAAAIIGFTGHLVILAVCWAVVTRVGRQSFFSTLGWNWAGLGVASRFYLVGGVVIGVFLLQSLLRLFLPEAETTLFDEMLKSSLYVRILIAVMAVLTAPIVEEVVYRGILYSGLRSKTGLVFSTLTVALIFCLAHFQQYQGAWASLTGLFILSLALTLIRALGKTLLPCFVIHLVYNLIGATLILLSG